MYRAVIFDLGGVIQRTEDPGPRTALAQSLGITRAELESLVFNSPSGEAAQRGEIEIEEHFEIVLKALNLDVDELETFQARFWGGDETDHELVDFIRGLQEKYKTALLSNAFSDLRHYLTHVWKINDAFDQLVISAEVNMVKPELEIYRFTLDQVGVEPAEAVFVDDFKSNVEGARQAGLTAIHFRERGQALSELQAVLGLPGE
jgi:putative hydrolase of the HAD superfamily